MFKKLVSLAIAVMVVLSVAVVPVQETAYAETDSQRAEMASKDVYKVVGYKSHDCVLTANVYMLRRALILEGSSTWDEITNTVLRPYACISRYSSSLRYSYSYSKDGMTYTVNHLSLSGSYDQKVKKLKDLLQKHPEGIVVRGRAKAGFGHGVLLTDYSNGTFYAADSTQNIRGANKGILKYSATTMAGISTLKDIWYVEASSGESISSVKTTKITGINAQKNSDSKIRISWKTPGVDLDGYAVYKSTSKDGTYVLVGTTDASQYTISDKNNGKTYYYKVKGYKVMKGKKIYTGNAVITIEMSSGEEVDDDELANGEVEEPEETIQEDEAIIDENFENTDENVEADDDSDLEEEM